MTKILPLLLLLALPCFHSLAFATLTDGLLAYYCFDDEKNIGKDCSGNGNNGLVVGQINSVIGWKGKAADLADYNASHIHVPNNPSFQIIDDISISFSINLTEDLSDYNRYRGLYTIFDKGILVGLNEQTDVSYAVSSYIGAATTKQQLGKWRHYVFVLSNKNNTAKIYIDGVLIKSDSFSANLSNAITEDLYIGIGSSTDPRFQSRLYGYLDELRFYNRALGTDEITTIYQQGQNTYAVNELGNFVDFEKTSIDYKNSKINIFLKEIRPSITKYRLIVLVDNEIIKNIVNPREINKMSIAYDYKQAADKLITVQLYANPTVKNGIETDGTLIGEIYGVQDNVRLVDTPDNHAILASRTLAKTQPHNGNECINAHHIATECNNYFYSDELPITSRQVAIQNTLTHRIIDFDKIVDNRLIHSAWSSSPYGKLALKNQKPTGDNNRIPLLLIHGWQGNFGLRNPAYLGLWKNSELHYSQHLLNYYLTSPALQKKYHIYLYHYPSYKHITYNAFILEQLLKEVGENFPHTDLGRVITNKSDNNVPTSGLTLVGHSTGGLVARSLIEEYNGLADLTVSGTPSNNINKLNQLISLDTPHHGSTSSELPNLVEVNRYFVETNKDLNTQGAADINWDNYDKRISDTDITNTNIRYRWRKIEAQLFDSKFCADCQTMNPWLLNLNQQFENTYTDLEKNKYIFYVGWLSSPDLVYSPSLITMTDYRGNINTLDNDTFNLSGDEWIANADIPNGGLAPITSTMLSSFSTGNSHPFAPTKSDYIPVMDDFSTFSDNNWHIPTQSRLNVYNPNTNNLNLAHSILISKESGDNPYSHPYNIPYRIFLDYDNEKMINGAYKDGILLSELGIWDQFISKNLIVGNDLKTTAFQSNLLRNQYIFAASSYRGDKSILGRNVKSVYNPLKTEPLYLVLERDLLLPKLQAPSHIDFGSISKSKTISVNLSNRGVGDLQLTGFQISGDDSKLFKLLNVGVGSCSKFNGVLAMTKYCSISITLQPNQSPLTDPTKTISATLVIKSNDLASPELQIPIAANLN